MIFFMLMFYVIENMELRLFFKHKIYMNQSVFLKTILFFLKILGFNVIRFNIFEIQSLMVKKLPS